MTTQIYSIVGVPIKFSHNINDIIPEATIIGQLKVLSNFILQKTDLINNNISLNWGDNTAIIQLNDPDWFEIQSGQITTAPTVLNTIIIKMPLHLIFTKYYTEPINYNLNFSVSLYSNIINFSSQALIYNSLFQIIGAVVIPTVNNIVNSNTIISRFKLDDTFVNDLKDFSCMIDWGDNSEINLGKIKVSNNNIYQVLNNVSHYYPNENKIYKINIKLQNSKSETITLINEVIIKFNPILNINIIEPQPINFKAIKNSQINTVIGQFRINSNIIMSVSDFFSTGGNIIIDWGDNTTSGVSFLSNNLFSSNNVFILKTSNINSHTYNKKDNYNVSIKVIYNNFETIIASFCEVEDASLIPLADLIINSNTFKINSNTIIGSFTEINSELFISSNFIVLIDWGDNCSNLSFGKTQRIPNTQNYQILTNNDHYYSQNGTYKLRVIISTLDWREIIVNPTIIINVPPTAIKKPITGILINIPNLIVCKKEKFKFKTIFTDINNSLAPYTVSLIWGDDTVPTIVVPTQIGTSNQFLIEEKHKYSKCGTYLITVIVNLIPSIGIINVIDCDC